MPTTDFRRLGKASSGAGESPALIAPTALDIERAAAYAELRRLLGLRPWDPHRDELPPVDQRVAVVFRRRFGIEAWQTPWEGGDPWARVRFAAQRIAAERAAAP